MLFPGAIYILAFVLALVMIAICIVLAFGMGAITHWLSQVIVKRTAAYKRFEQGFKDSYKWWFNFSSWAGSVMLASFIVFVYTAAGPTVTLIKWLGR